MTQIQSYENNSLISAVPVTAFEQLFTKQYGQEDCFILGKKCLAHDMNNLSQCLPINKHCTQVFPRWLSDKATNARDVGSVPRSGRFPGEGHANHFQENCVNRGA